MKNSNNTSGQDGCTHKKKIHFILPGGGVKGSFQAGFLYELCQNYRDYFTISRIDGTSVGALNGLAVACGCPEKLSETWNNIKHMSDIFSNKCNVPYLEKVVTGYQLYCNYSLYGNDKLLDIINGVIESETTQEVSMDKFNCVVTAVRKGTYQYVNGDDPSINEYVLASASPWIVSPPRLINDELCTDGGLLQTIPTDHIGKTEADISVIVGYDLNCEVLTGHEGDSAFTYFGRLIDITRLHHCNIAEFKQKIELLRNSTTTVIIDNPLNIGFLDFNEAEIKRGFDLGKKSAHLFAKENLGIHVA